jgi:ribosomal protein S18 acetylase RimI-like enzyme
VTSVDVRAYEDTDEAAVVALWDACFVEQRSWNQPRELIRRKVAVARDLFLVATLDRRIVGAVIAGWDGHRGWLYHLAVAPDVRRRGIGSRLVRAAESLLQARGCPKVNLQILAANRDVVRFYERLGFAVEERVSMGKPLATPRAP